MTGCGSSPSHTSGGGDVDPSLATRIPDEWLVYPPMPIPVSDSDIQEAGPPSDEDLATDEFIFLSSEEAQRTKHVRFLISFGNKQAFQGDIDPFLMVKTPRMIIGADDRLENTNNYERDPAAKMTCKIYIDFPDASYTCSGTVIGERHVLTAAHCVHKKAEGGWAKSVRIVPAFKDGVAPYGIYTAKKGSTFKAWTQDGNFYYDMAVLTTEDYIGKKIGEWSHYGELDSSDRWAGAFSYPADKGGMRQWYCYGDVYHNGRSTIDVMPGSSGAAIWVPGNWSPFWAIAVISHSKSWDKEFNYATIIDLDKRIALDRWVLNQ